MISRLIVAFAFIFLAAHVHFWHSRQVAALEQERLELQKEIDHQRLLAEIIKRESSGRTHVWGQDGEYGPCQFKEATFRHFSRLYGLTYLRWQDPVDQVVLMDKMIRDGHGKHWTTYEDARRAVVLARYGYGN